MNKPFYPGLASAMAERGETAQDVANLIKISLLSVYNKLNGKNDWKISEIEVLTKHYNSDYYKLFSK